MKLKTIEESIFQGKPFQSMIQKASVNIIYTAHWLQQKHNQVFKTFDLSSQQFNVLRILRGQHPKSVTVKLISERMIDQSSNVSRLIEKLLAKDLIIRQTSPQDRRRVDVQINQKGLDLLSEIDQKLEGFEGDFKEVSDEELETLSNILDKIRGISD